VLLDLVAESMYYDSGRITIPWTDAMPEDKEYFTTAAKTVLLIVSYWLQDGDHTYAAESVKDQVTS
jgi:hypothetical protein